MGGIGLAALGCFVRQSTKDGDVVGEAFEHEGKLEIRMLSYFPPFLEMTIKKVARDFCLHEKMNKSGTCIATGIGTSVGDIPG